MTAGIKANVDGSAAIQVGGVDAITLTSAGAASFVTSPMTIQGGSAAAPSLTFSGDTNTGIFSPAADTIAFTEGGVESMRIDASGRLLIGGTSGAAILTVVGGTQMIHTFTGASAAFAWGQFDSSGNASINNQANANLLFATNNTERARFTSSGDFSVNGGGGGKVGISTGNAIGLRVDTTTAGESAIITGSLSNLQVRHPAAGLELINTGGNAFRIVANTNGVSLAVNGTSWAAISDERRKDIIEPITDAAQKVSTLRAVIGKYDTDEPNTRRAFLIAQDVQAVLPEAVCIGDGESDTLMLAYTDTIPLLVAAIKELKAELDATKAEVALLKGAA